MRLSRRNSAPLEPVGRTPCQRFFRTVLIVGHCHSERPAGGLSQNIVIEVDVKGRPAVLKLGYQMRISCESRHGCWLARVIKSFTFMLVVRLLQCFCSSG